MGRGYGHRRSRAPPPIISEKCRKGNDDGKKSEPESPGSELRARRFLFEGCEASINRCNLPVNVPDSLNLLSIPGCQTLLCRRCLLPSNLIINRLLEMNGVWNTVLNKNNASGTHSSQVRDAAFVQLSISQKSKGFIDVHRRDTMTPSARPEWRGTGRVKMQTEPSIPRPIQAACWAFSFTKSTTRVFYRPAWCLAFGRTRLDKQARCGDTL